MQEGCDADIAVFDPDMVTDNSTYNIGEGMLPTTGNPHVLVNGVVVVRDTEILPVFPGKPIRFPVMPRGQVSKIKINPPYRPGMGENTRRIEHLNLGCC
jgi:N-acyl-D-amino-acid deacylase